MKTKYYLLIFFALLPVLILRDYTPGNELRYLSIVDEALANGHFFTFTNQGIPYADKPPLYFWLLMFAKWLCGGYYMGFLSMFSVLPALGIVAVMNKWVSAEANQNERLLGGFMLMSSGLFLGASIVLRMDMLMTFFIVLSLYTFYKMLKEPDANSRRNAWLFPVYIFLAVFAKGPIGIIVPLLSTLVFLLLTGRIRTIGRYWGWRTWVVLLVGFTGWFGGVYLEAGPDYLHNLVFHQTIDRAVNSFHHEGPFYYYLLSVWYSLAPWSLLFAGLIIAGWVCGYIRSDLERFFLTVVITTFIVLSCVSSKLAIYLLPAYPFIAYLAVLMIARFRWNHWLALAVAIPTTVCLLAIFGLMLLPSFDNRLTYLQHPLIYVAAGLLTLGGGISLFFLYFRKRLYKAIVTLAISLFVTIFVGGWALLYINDQLGYAGLCRKAMEISKLKELTGYSTLYIPRSESMDVFLHEDVRVVTTEDVLHGKSAGTVLMIAAPKAEKDKVLMDFLENKAKFKAGIYWIVPL